MTRDKAFIKYLIEDRRRLTLTNIHRLIKWLKNDDGSESLANFMFIEEGKKLDLCVNNDEEVFNKANELVTMLDEILTQDKLRGMTLNYTLMDVGEITYCGEQIRICPFCGKAGVVYDNPNYHQTTHHKIYVHSGMLASIIESCAAESYEQ